MCLDKYNLPKTGGCIVLRSIFFSLTFGMMLIGILIAIHVNFTIGTIIAAASGLYFLIELP